MKFILMTVMLCLLMGCNNASQSAQQNTQSQAPTQKDKIETTSEKATTPIPISLDKAALTTIAPKQTADYPYPFDIDSQAVKNYAKAYGISQKQAQHAMTLAMASPEALGKILDQIQGEYLGHSLTDGADMSLVIYTTDHVMGDSFDYVIADKFGEGLTLPVIITTKANASKMGLDGTPQVDINKMSKTHTDGQTDDK